MADTGWLHVIKDCQYEHVALGHYVVTVVDHPLLRTSFRNTIAKYQNASTRSLAVADSSGKFNNLTLWDFRKENILAI